MKHLGSTTAALMVPIAFAVGCQPAADAAARGGNGQPMLASLADTIAHGRAVIINHGCGDCHGGGDNPAAPTFLIGYRDKTDDSLFMLFKIPTPGGIFWTRPRNLTPDNETGLGRFSERQIYNALKFGLRPGETPDVEITSMTPGQGNFPENPKYLAPPMPWPAWRHMPDTDLWAIAAYLKRGLKPQRNKVMDSDGPPDFWAGLYNGLLQVGASATTPAFPTDREVAPPAKP